jgi:uncharacterized lipoprotein YmbA
MLRQRAALAMTKGVLGWPFTGHSCCSSRNKQKQNMSITIPITDFNGRYTDNICMHVKDSMHPD